MEIDSHLGCAMSGLTADARTMIDHARVTAQNHSFTYNEKIKVESATQAVCDLALRFGESMDNEDAMMVNRNVLIRSWRLADRFGDFRVDRLVLRCLLLEWTSLVLNCECVA